jgi:hypothetical protein
VIFNPGALLLGLDDVYLSIDVVKDGERQSCQRNQLSTSLRT